MSHVVTIQTRLHDPVAIGATCRRLNLPEPTEGTAHLYSGEATGLLLQLPVGPTRSHQKPSRVSRNSTTSRATGATKPISIASCRSTLSSEPSWKPA